MQHIMDTYNRSHIDLVDGNGIRATDVNGKEYLDFTAGIAVNALGHCHPELIKVVQEQSTKIWHTSNIFSSHLAEEYAKKLCTTSFADKVFFCNSGSESLETVIKAIRIYNATTKPHKKDIITFKNAFHGRTIATISATFRNTDGFEPLLNGFKQAIFNDLESVKALIDENTAGILLEPTQGEGGANPATQEFMQGLRLLCDEHNILLALDEVQIGMGRSGAIWGYEKYGVDPDIIAAAKGLGGGFPIGACLATNDACRGMVAGTHGSTYGGNPMAIAVASKVFDIVSHPEFLHHVNTMHAYLATQLQKINGICSVHGTGLLMGINFDTGIDSIDVLTACRNNGLLLVRASNNVVRLLPPLIVTKSDIDEAMPILQKSITAVSQ